MARLDVRVDGRTRFSRAVDDAVIERVLAATAEEPVVRNFGGKAVKVVKPRKAAPMKLTGGTPDVIVSGTSDDQHS